MDDAERDGAVAECNQVDAEQLLVRELVSTEWQSLYPRSQKWQLDIGSGAAARDVIASAVRMA